MRIRQQLIFLLFLLLSMVCSVLGQEEKPLIEVRSAVDTAQITIGDRITYSLTIDHVKGMRIEQPGPGVNLGQFEIKDYQIADPEEYDNRIRLRYTYVISVFDTGKFTIPPFPVAYFPQDTAKTYKIIEASPIDINVRSVISDEKRELKDIKAPVWIPFDYTIIIIIALLVVLLTGGGYLGYRIYRQRKEKGYLFRPPPPPRPAHEIALQELEVLFAKDYLNKGHFKQFYIEISEIIRRYIEGRYFVPALEETSREIMLELEKQEMEAPLKASLTNFLELSDLVKFAKYIPGAEENDKTAGWARYFIEETKIIFEETQPEMLEPVSEK
jgi:hypothetical protein